MNKETKALIKFLKNKGIFNLIYEYKIPIDNLNTPEYRKKLLLKLLENSIYAYDRYEVVKEWEFFYLFFCFEKTKKDILNEFLKKHYIINRYYSYVKNIDVYIKAYETHELISQPFIWSKTKENFAYWEEVHTNYRMFLLKNYPDLYYYNY